MNSKLAVVIAEEFDGYTGSYGDLLSLFLSVSITGAGVILLFLIVYSGLQIVMNAGKADAKPAALEQARLTLTYAIMGFLVVFTAYFMIRLLELLLGTTFLTLNLTL